MTELVSLAAHVWNEVLPYVGGKAAKDAGQRWFRRSTSCRCKSNHKRIQHKGRSPVWKNYVFCL
eukprot:6260467-Amphidinium_carterae.1